MIIMQAFPYYVKALFHPAFIGAACLITILCMIYLSSLTFYDCQWCLKISSLESLRKIRDQYGTSLYDYILIIALLYPWLANLTFCFGCFEFLTMPQAGSLHCASLIVLRAVNGICASASLILVFARLEFTSTFLMLAIVIQYSIYGLIYAQASLIILKYDAVVSRQGLIGLLPSRFQLWLATFNPFNFLTRGSSILDLWCKICPFMFKLSDEELEIAISSLPACLKPFATQRGIVGNLPKPIRLLLLPEQRESHVQRIPDTSKTGQFGFQFVLHMNRSQQKIRHTNSFESQAFLRSIILRRLYR